MRHFYVFALLGVIACSSAMADQRDSCPPEKFMDSTNIHFTRNDAMAYLNTFNSSN